MEDVLRSLLKKPHTLTLALSPLRTQADSPGIKGRVFKCGFIYERINKLENSKYKIKVFTIHIFHCRV